MRIFVGGNCQTEQLVLALRLVLPPSVTVDGGRCHTEHLSELGDSQFIEKAQNADVLLTNRSASHFVGLVDAAKIIEFPNLFFGGFHPDHTGLALKNQPGKKLKFSTQVAENRLARLHISSALAAWAFKKGLSVPATTALFRADVFHALGYFHAYAVGYEALRQDFSDLGLDFAPLKRLFHGREIFMWGMEHPKLALVFCLCESILQRLNLPGADRIPSLAGVIIDTLEKEYACGCYPPIAEYLGVEGSWAMRIDQTVHPDLPSYLHEFFWLLSRFPRNDIQILDRDAGTFSFSEMNAALDNFL